MIIFTKINLDAFENVANSVIQQTIRIWVPWAIITEENLIKWSFRTPVQDLMGQLGLYFLRDNVTFCIPPTPSTSSKSIWGDEGDKTIHWFRLENKKDLLIYFTYKDKLVHSNENII